jgi:plastocyanin
MRITGLMAGATVALAACGGGEQPPASQPPAPAPVAAPAAGATHDVNMVLEGTAYKYVPSELTIKAGDKIVFHNVSGGPHNVQFWADSIPAGTAAALDAAMPNSPSDKLGQLNGPLLIEPNATYEIVFAGLPNGEYRFFCTPHLAMGMTGKLTIAP